MDWVAATASAMASATVLAPAAGSFRLANPSASDRDVTQKASTNGWANAADLAPLFRFYLDGSRREHGLTAGFDCAGRLVAFSCHDGDIGRVAMFMTSVRAVISEPRTAVIVIAHNHVIGDHRPSAADIDATRRIACVCNLLGLRLLDHLIFTGCQQFSFAEAGIL